MADRSVGLRSRNVALGAAFLGLAGSSLACGVGANPSPPQDPVYQPGNYGMPVDGQPAPQFPVQQGSPIPPDPEPAYEEDTYVFYCVDEAEVIVDPDNCDESLAITEDWPYLLAFSPLFARNLRIGTRLPAGGDWISASDTVTRQAWGLPSRITNGSTVRSGIIGGSGSGTVGG